LDLPPAALKNHQFMKKLLADFAERRSNNALLLISTSLELLDSDSRRESIPAIPRPRFASSPGPCSESRVIQSRWLRPLIHLCGAEDPVVFQIFTVAVAPMLEVPCTAEQFFGLHLVSSVGARGDLNPGCTCHVNRPCPSHSLDLCSLEDGLAHECSSRGA
jgi:hypothetical protein